MKIKKKTSNIVALKKICILTSSFMVTQTFMAMASVNTNAPRLRPDIVMQTSSNVKVTIDDWGASSKKQYKIDNGEWQDYTSAIAVTKNGMVYARGLDSNNASTPVASLKVNNIISSNPTDPTTPTNPIEGKDMILYVSPDGTSAAKGTIDSPMSLQAAITTISENGTIYMRAGTYKYSEAIIVELGNNGSEGKMKSIVAYQNEKPILDFSSESYNANDTSVNARGLQINANYWYIRGLEIKGAADNGIFIGGNNNRIELCVTDENRDTGLQISRRKSDLSNIADWPSNNLILNCTSYNNIDASGENADGFAAKLTCGNGNVFNGCISYNNSDDGWDLYTKTATGQIGPVTIKNCIAFRNGKTTDGRGTGNGDGNGFKLGGDKIANNHFVENCISFENNNHGFTDNSNPGVISLKNCTSFNNSQKDGKKSDFDFARDKTLSNNIFENLLSFHTNKVGSDKFKGTATNSVFCNSEKYYRIDATQVVDSNVKTSMGTQVTGPTQDDFISIVPPVVGEKVHDTWRNSDGSINVGNFLKLKDSSLFKGMGANLSDK
jgi:hypothetical protein